MGSTNSNEYTKKQKQITVITLNYSGILLSPFEFFSKDPNNEKLNDIQEKLSTTFQMLLESQYKEFNKNKKQNKFKWNLGKIDQKMQIQRYTPIYHPNAGVKIDQKNKQCSLMSLKQFQTKWLQAFQQKVINVKGLQYKQQEKQQAKLFDLMCYKCILATVYPQIKVKNQHGQLTFEEIPKLNAQIYLKYMQNMFKKSFLDQDKKIQKTFKAFDSEKIDIAFVQEANQRLVKQLEVRSDKYIVFSSNCQSIIITRKDKFQNFYSKQKNPLDLNPQLKEQLNWNKDTTVAFVDNLILISGHLSSKKDKNPQQSYQMVQSLKKLQEIYPMCHIIAGLDGNSFLMDTYRDYCKEKDIKEFSIPQQWLIYPDKSQVYTTSKQRTYLQPQIVKANQKAQVSRDYIIFLKGKQVSIKNKKVCTILNASPQDIPILPCQDHPYDHYVVKASAVINVVTSLSQKQIQE